jgi:hypothetical protein
MWQPAENVKSCTRRRVCHGVPVTDTSTRAASSLIKTKEWGLVEHEFHYVRIRTRSINSIYTLTCEGVRRKQHFPVRGWDKYIACLWGGNRNRIFTNDRDETKSRIFVAPTQPKFGEIASVYLIWNLGGNRPLELYAKSESALNLAMYDIYWLAMVMLFMESKYLEYISSITIIHNNNNNQT